MLTAVVAGLLLQAMPEHAFALAGHGRFAQMADLATLSRDGDLARIRVLQVAGEGFRAGDTAYWGGWSWWAFDCAARTADRLDFASVKEDGAEGPAVADNRPAAAVAPGSDTESLLTTACAAEPPSATATTVAEAVRQGRTVLTPAD